MPTFPDAPSTFPGVFWERQPSQKPSHFPLKGFWEPGNVVLQPTIPGRSQTDDQPRHGSRAEPCRVWEGSSSARESGNVRRAAR